MKRILIIRTDRVGDVVMITPMIRELRKTFPDAFIATLTQPYTKDIFLHNPHVNVCLTDDLRKEEFWTVVKELRKYKFTDGLLVMPTERAAYQMFFAGIKNRVSVGHKLYSILTLIKGVSRNNYMPLRHEADYCMDLARKIGVVTDNIAPEIFLNEDERLQTLEFLRSKQVAEHDTKVFIHTGTRGSSPNWSEQKYLQLIKAIFEEYDDPTMKIILTAKEMSKEFLDDINTINSNRVINISNEIGSLRDLIKIIGMADIFICSSTGPAHLADALDVKAIVLHCHRPMNCVKYWGILNKHSINLEVSEDYCKTHCSSDQNTCAFEDGISIDEVIENMKFLLSK
jgi:ADP-heptose:LPS heptosyltransferase